MPIYEREGVVTNDPAYVATPTSAADRMARHLSERRDFHHREDQAPGTLDTWAATARNTNIIGRAVTHMGSRIGSGLTPFNIGDPAQTGRLEGFSPFRYLSDPKFWQSHPYAVGAYDWLVDARSEDEFELTLHEARQQHEDFQTMAEAGSAKTLTLSLLANIADPINLIPASAFYKTARGIGLVKALKNAGAVGITAGITNTIQEEILRSMSPGEERDRLTADLQAFGYGFAFGSGIGFLSAPNFKTSSRGWRRWASHENLESTRSKIHAAWETETPPKIKLSSLVDELEANRADLQQILDDGLPNDATPQQPHQVVLLHRAEDAGQNVAADRNARLWRQVQAKYGDRVQALEHPLQGDYDALSPLHRSLADTEQAIRNLVKSDAKAAGAAELADNITDYIAQRGTTAFGKAMSFFTPTGVVDRSVLDLAHAAYRSLFHQGTVSKAAAMDPSYRGVVPAEVLKDSYQVLLYDAMAQARDAYAPDRLHGALLDRTDADRITLSTGKKIAALATREPIRGAYADGTPFEIKPYNDYGTFIRTAMRLARERKAIDDGWAMLRDNRQQVPPQLQTASNAIRSFYDQMLDLADQASLLPGKRTLEARHAEYDDAFDELQSAYAEMDAVEAQYPLAFNEPAETIAQRVVDEADDWHAPITDQEMWDRMIGPARTIETPIGPVKIGANQFAKMQAKDRADFSGLVLPTLTKPSLIMREADGAVKFVRAFRRGKETIFLSISRDIEDAGQVVISNYPIRRAQLEKAIESGKPLYSTALDASAEASPQQAAQAGGRLDGESIIDQQGRQVQTLYTSVPKELIGVELFDWGSKGLRLGTKQTVRGATGRPRKTWDSAWNHDLKSIAVGKDPELMRALRQVTDEIWIVRRKRGQYWIRDRYMVPKAAIAEAEKLIGQRKARRATERVQAAEVQLAKTKERFDQAVDFNINARQYLTRRFLTEEIRTDPESFKAWLKRSWREGRRILEDPETRARRLADEHELPILDEMRDSLRISEAIRTEGELRTADPSLWTRYKAMVDEMFERESQSVVDKLTNPQHSHGVVHTDASPRPLMKRTLIIDEGDPAAARFLDNDAERVLGSYYHAVGGQIATRKSVQAAAKSGWFGARGSEIETSGELITHVRDEFNELHKALAEVDKQAGTSHAVAVRRDMDRTLRRLERRASQLHGQGLMDPTHGANAMLAWGGNTLMNINYLALLGSQVLAAVNDVAAVTLFSEITSVPRNIRYLVRAMAPLKNAPKRELRLLRMGFESEHARVRSIGDLDHDNLGFGAGYGRVRRVTGAIDAGLDRMNRAFNELTLINSWNRYVKRGAAYIAMDRLVRHSQRFIQAHELKASGTPWEKALRDVGLSRWDAARLQEGGIGLAEARRLQDMLFEFGTDENGKPIHDIVKSPQDMATYSDIILPNAGAWLEKYGDDSRHLYDIYTGMINSQVERAMVLTPSLGDKPLINDHWWGRALNQFQTFGFAWANQVARPLAQRPLGKQLATISAYLGTGAIVDAIRNHLSGRRDFDETMSLWATDPLAMTYAVVNVSGLNGWTNRPMAFLDKANIGIGSALGNTQVSRAAFQSRSFWGSLSPVADMIDRLAYATMDPIARREFNMRHLHNWRKTWPFQNWIGVKIATRFLGFDPFITNAYNLDRTMDQEPRP